MGESVRISSDGGVRRLTLCRPEAYNTITPLIGPFAATWAKVQHARRYMLTGDGVARHSQEGVDVVRRTQQVGFRQAVREHDRPFSDCGERRRPDQPS